VVEKKLLTEDDIVNRAASQSLDRHLGIDWNDPDARTFYNRERMRRVRGSVAPRKHCSAFGEYVGQQWREIVKRFLG
jgi:hypothetical protein